ncbi:MAG: hypothetical protein M3362_23705 [Acidobacteriota bacterium]|nr:hypothetical protein [Acidobacteriota bacterium]
MKSPVSYPLGITLSCSLLFTFALLITHEARCQDMRMPFTAAPPPMKFVPRTERDQLSGITDAKAHTREALQLAEERLARAEQLTAGQQYEAATEQLGIYQGLIEDAIRFLEKGANGKSNKARDIYKNLDLALHTHCARLEAIRRITPSEYAVNVKAICEYARDVRTAALNSFFGDTVIKETSENEKSQVDANSKDSSATEAKKQ